MKPCACGCEGEVKDVRKDYLPHHRPEFLEAPCACGCGEMKKFRHKWDMKHHPYLPYHHQAMMRRNNPAPERFCECGCGTRLADRPNHGELLKRWGKWSRFAPGHSNKGNAETAARLRSYATSKKRLDRLHEDYLARRRYVLAEPVQRVLRARGITAAMLHHDLRIARAHAQSLFKTQKYMTPDWAERLLRYAAGLPRTASPREQRAAQRKEFAVRRGRQVNGKRQYNPKPEAAFERRFDGLLANTEHLKDADSKKKFVSGEYDGEW